MNRLLVIPAGCCLAAYVATFSVLHGAESSARVARPETPAANVATPDAAPPAASYATRPLPPPPLLLTLAQADEELRAFETSYESNQREWAAAPERIMSRAAPRPVPTSVKFDHTIARYQPREQQLLATLTITETYKRDGDRTTQVPCVLDRATKELTVCVNGLWMPAKNWLPAAPRRLKSYQPSSVPTPAG